MFFQQGFGNPPKKKCKPPHLFFRGLFGGPTPGGALGGPPNCSLKKKNNPIKVLIARFFFPRCLAFQQIKELLLRTSFVRNVSILKKKNLACYLKHPPKPLCLFTQVTKKKGKKNKVIFSFFKSFWYIPWGGKLFLTEGDSGNVGKRGGETNEMVGVYLWGAFVQKGKSFKKNNWPTHNSSQPLFHRLKPPKSFLILFPFFGAFLSNFNFVLQGKGWFKKKQTLGNFC